MYDVITSDIDVVGDSPVSRVIDGKRELVKTAAHVGDRILTVAPNGDSMINRCI
jgi:hypothetical protein